MCHHHHRNFCGKFSNEAISTKANVFCQRTILCRNQFYKSKYYKSKQLQLITNKFFKSKYYGKRNHYQLPEAVTHRFSGKISLNSQENLCVRVSLIINMLASASKTSGGCFLATNDFLAFSDFSGAHLGGGSRGSGPCPFLKQSKLSPKFLNHFRRNALKNRFKKRKSSLKRYFKNNQNLFLTSVSTLFAGVIVSQQFHNLLL